MDYSNLEGFIFLDGKLLKWTDAKLHVLSHGLHYASSVFEGERAYGGKVFKELEHTERLIRSANTLGFNIPYGIEEICKIRKDVLEANNIIDGYIRPVAWRGSEMMGVSAQNTKINVAIAIWDWPAYFDPKVKLNGIKLNISKWQRPPQNSSPWDSKAAGLYMICTLSKHEAEKNGFTDSLMLDHEGILLKQQVQIFFLKIKIMN